VRYRILVSAPIAGRYDAAWAQYRRIRRQAMIVWMGGAVLAAMLSGLVERCFGHAAGGVAFWFLASAWLLGNVAMTIRWDRFRCPAWAKASSDGAS